VVQVEHALLERLDDLVDLVDVVVLDDQRQQAGDDFRHRLQRKDVAHHALLDADGHAGAGQHPAEIGVAGERGPERLQLGEGRIDVARFRDDVEQGARVPARGGAASHGCPSPGWRSDRSAAPDRRR
jgi:hypothetical protein